MIVKTIFTNERRFHDRWGVNAIARSEKLTSDYKWTTPRSHECKDKKKTRSQEGYLRTNYLWMPFSWFDFRFLVLYILAHSRLGLFNENRALASLISNTCYKSKCLLWERPIYPTAEVYREKSRSPRTDPWGTPFIIWENVDIVLLLAHCPHSDNVSKTLNWYWNSYFSQFFNFPTININNSHFIDGALPSVIHHDHEAAAITL